MKKYIVPFINYGTLVGSIIFGGSVTVNYLVKDLNNVDKIDTKKNNKYNLIFFMGR